MRQLIAALVFVVGMPGASATAAESVELELVLIADASRSIDDAEIRFQRQGYAAAITHPEVLGAIAQGFEQRIAVTSSELTFFLAQILLVCSRFCCSNNFVHPQRLAASRS